MVELRDYQKDYILALRESMRKNKRLILCATTGAGKTIMFSYMTLNAFNMMQTLARRLDVLKDFISELDLIIIDEAHKTIFDKLFNYISEKTYVIGATATPLREGKNASLELFYNDIIQVIDTQELIRKQNLSKCTSYGVKVDLKGVKIVKGDYDEKSLAERYSEIELFHGVIENYTRICKGKKTLVFSSNINSSLELVREMQNKGINARHVDCYMNDRAEVLEWFKNTPDAVLSNYGILTTGFDEPTIEVVILYRATKSLILFLQMVGRGSRVIKDKKDFIVLDFGNNIKRHGFWEENRTWTLKKKEKKEGEAPIKECPECCYMMFARIMECPNCGYIFGKSEKEIEEEEIVYLQKLSNNKINEILENANFKKLELIKKAKGYKDGWIWHRLKTLTDLEDYGKYKNYKKGWAKRQFEKRK